MDQQENKKEETIGTLVLKVPVYVNDKMTFSDFLKKGYGHFAYFGKDDRPKCISGPNPSIKGYKVKTIGGYVFISEAAIDDAFAEGEFDVNININF